LHGIVLDCKLDDLEMCIKYSLMPAPESGELKTELPCTIKSTGSTAAWHQEAGSKSQPFIFPDRLISVTASIAIMFATRNGPTAWPLVLGAPTSILGHSIGPMVMGETIEMGSSVRNVVPHASHVRLSHIIAYWMHEMKCINHAWRDISRKRSYETELIWILIVHGFWASWLP
jgi:hypothetical protein